MRYRYKHLRVMCVEGPYFRTDQLRAAVERLKQEPQTGYTGLSATTLVNVDRYKLLAQPMLQLEDILGKRPAEVWEMFDRAVDAQIARMSSQWTKSYRDLT